ncbi:hypothetical protein C8A01DRAFT_34330 [Parachaetomium inaequale]|uniref:Uncharacterized protein n=1 Tax=Parachaetomium inaequale TaxID=2588326 RepID=A0AAN6PIQ3_9PEZI|nr:hypothetical protein C8A01DRAFT_34330 [Parachaetomium inaequale]
MSLTVASTFARRGRPSKAIHPAALSSLGSGAVQQTRSYKFGRLASYLEPYMRPDVYTRHYSHGHKYCENLYRRRSWDKHSLAEDAKATLKRAVHNYWSPERRARHGAGRFLNTDAAPRKTPDNPDGVRPGQNIEDVERAPLEHLLFGDKKGQPAMRNGRPFPSSRRNADADYHIDPITNRRVPKKSVGSTYSASGRGVDIPIRTFKPYKPQFESFKAPVVEQTQAPVFSDGPPPAAELRMYGQDKPWDSANQTDGTAAKAPKSPVVNHYGTPPSLLDTLTWEHKEVQWHRNDTIASASASTTAALTSRPDGPEYSDLQHYTAVRYQEPDGKSSDQQPAAKPADLGQYGAVRAHEPDGKYKLESASPAEPQELNKYGAVRAHEPDGKYKIEPESPVDPQELNKYGAVRSHEPDGKYKLESESSVAPEELKKYGAVRAHEPDGKYAAEYTEAPDAAELASYSKPILAHEPDGKYAANHVHPEYDAAELAKYRKPFFSYEPDGKYAASYVEAQRDEAELSQYKAFRSHEPDGKYAASYVQEKPDSSELATYGAFHSHEPDGKYALRNTAPVPPAETQKYQAFRSHEPDGKYAAEAQAAGEAQDLANHEAFTYEDAETRPLPQECQPSKGAADLEGYRVLRHDGASTSTDFSAYEDYDPAELRKYQAVRWNEPDGKPATTETRQTPLEDDLNGETPKHEKAPYRKKVEELMAQAAAESDTSDMATSSLQAADGKNSRGQKALTGNYVRDFPEEFSKSWTTATTQSTSSLLSPEQKTSDGPVQPALERFSKGTGDASSSNKPANPTPPALYRILVYDPTMQCIETAETTSIVPDSAAPLTPAEVLLRISNPAKFFPHFAPLQAQGFEIVSGSGDVLIFRKVRDAVAETASNASTTTTTASAAVNPIDMTGERRDYTVAAGRFASPTGFVNYDLPPAADGAARTERRRAAAAAQEQASSSSSSSVGDEGKESTGEVRKKGKRSLPRKVAVGAACLVGSAYSVGVVSEYFRNGGVDGRGPKGF